MVTVKVDEDVLIEMFNDRVKFWTEDGDIQELYNQYYESLVYGGCFEGMQLDIMSIVDNDYINWTSVISKDDFENYNIEDEDDERILARYNGWYLVSE